MQEQLKFIMVGIAALSCAAHSAEFFVSPTGSDTNPGTYTAPFQTLEKAQGAVRAALPSATEPIHVQMRGGTYYLGSTLEFGTADSGSASVPVTWSGYSNETAVISGALPLSPNWSTYSGDILVASIGSGLAFDLLFVDDKLQVMARYPNYDPDVAILNGYAGDAISSAKVNSWADPAGGFYRGLHSSEWGGNSYRITGKSGSSLNLEWVGDNNRGSGVHSTYRMVENIFEELDAPGEWYYDEPDGKLYFYPPAGLDPNTAVFEAASLEELIRVVGTAGIKVKHLTFSNLTFTHTHRTLFTRNYEPMNRSDWRLARAGAIYIEDAEHITISDSNFDRVGGNAVFFSGCNRNHLVTNNEFLDNGATCVNVCGSKDALWNVNEWDDYPATAEEIIFQAGPKTDDYPRDITISYNHMVNMGRFEKQTSGVNLFLAESIRISHNTIHHCPRAGINICDGAWGGHIIEFNDIFDCVRETSDHGPFNAWGRDRFYSIGGYNHSGSDGAVKRPYAFLDAWKTVVIRNNRFHYDEPTSFGIDLDDGSSNFEIYNNLLLNTQIKLREGFDRVVYNNIQINEQCEFHVWYNQSRDVFTNNIVVNDTAYNSKYMYSGKASSAGATLDWNLFYNAGDDVTLSDDNWVPGGYDANSVIANPLFVNAVSNDYTVATNSPALDLGFVNFPMDQFGKPGAPEPGAISYDPGPPPYSDGEPLMGGSVASIYDDATRSFLGAPDLNGVFFESLPYGTYAQTEGFEQYDLIRTVNGTDVTTKQSFWLRYNSIPGGSTVNCTVLRNQHEEPFSFSKTDGYEHLNNTAGTVYTGSWSTQLVAACFNGDLMVSSTVDDAFEFTFHGTDVSFESVKGPDMGSVDIYIDGVFRQTVSCYSSSTLYQQTVYSHNDLIKGLHTLRVVNAENKTMALDSVHVGLIPNINYQVSTSQSVTNTPPTVSNDDLAQTHVLSTSATGGDAVATRHGELFNGVIGDADSGTGDSGVVRMSSDNSITVTFDTSVNTFGYDLTGITTIFGWNPAGGGRSNQGYELILGFVDGSVVTLAGPEHWEPNSPATYWTSVSFSPEGTNTVMASGVKFVTFDIAQNANAGSVVIGREFDVFGVPTVDPTAPPPNVSTNITVSTAKSGTAPAISTNDLAQTQYASSSGSGGNEADSEHDQLFNGQAGNEDGDTNDSGEVRLTSANSVTVFFDTSENTLGYDLTGITTHFGWGTDGGGRSNQGYEIILGFVSGESLTLAGPEHWEPNTPASYWTSVSFADAGGGALARGVKSVSFNMTQDANANGVVIAREFDLFGKPTLPGSDYAAAFIPSETTVSNGQFITQFSGAIGADYAVEWTSNLESSNGWNMVTNFQPLENSPTIISIPATNSAGFYRVRWKP